ncbi:uncharacterized protein LOC128954064 [Oppia nitens]|uniref:uncharacterized protein LOC128954064 n=1 Tax=Oppia nitens TaxID=1686743 RepID=UPI0023D9F840|nr:uncharacterized protein LOC128954064 [Oppia nitens]
MYSSILDSFRICEKIPQTIKSKIKLFYVFNYTFDRNVYENILFMTDERQVYGMGGNENGSLGLGNDIPQESPQLVRKLRGLNIKQFAHGMDFFMALTHDGGVYGWGKNPHGQLAREADQVDMDVPKPIWPPSRIEFFDNLKIIAISCGRRHSLALTSDGQVYGWGRNMFGQTGTGKPDENVAEPVKLIFQSDHCIAKIYCIYDSSYALTSDDRVYSWGENFNDELGHHTGAQTPDEDGILAHTGSIDVLIYHLMLPKLVDQLTDIVDVYKDDENGKSYFVGRDGRVFCCGYDPRSQAHYYVDYFQEVLHFEDIQDRWHLNKRNVLRYMDNKLLITYDNKFVTIDDNPSAITSTIYSNIISVYLTKCQFTHMTIDVDNCQLYYQQTNNSNLFVDPYLLNEYKHIYEICIVRNSWELLSSDITCRPKATGIVRHVINQLYGIANDVDSDNDDNNNTNDDNNGINDDKSDDYITNVDNIYRYDGFKYIYCNRLLPIDFDEQNILDPNQWFYKLNIDYYYNGIIEQNYNDAYTIHIIDCNYLDHMNNLPAILSHDFYEIFNDSSFPDHINRIRIDDKLGSGGFGTVYLANHQQGIQLGGYWAIKKIYIKNYNERNKFRALNEVRLLAKIQSRHVIKYRESFVQNQHLYISMDYYKYNLKSIIHLMASNVFKRQTQESIKFTEFFILWQLFCQLLDAVHYLHQLSPPIIHRDIKPENIMIDNRNAGLKLGDFGLAFLLENMDKKQSNAGTQLYMAPEVINFARYSTQSDIYSVGVTVEKLFGIDINSFNLSKMRELSPCELHPYIEWLISTIKSMHKVLPSKRHTSADIILEMTKLSPNWVNIFDTNVNAMYDVVDLRESDCRVINKIFDRYLKPFDNRDCDLDSDNELDLSSFYE